MKTTISAISILAAATTAMAGSAIQSNGGFELGVGADSQDWSEFGGGAPGTVSERVFGNAASGDYAHFISAVGSNSTGASAGISQNSQFVGLGTLAAGSSLQLSFDALSNFGPGGVGFYALRILNADGAIVADTGLQNFGNGSGQYTSYSSAALIVPAFGGGSNDFYAAFVEIVAVAGAFDGSFSSAYVDNVVITGTAIPAPGALALLGLGGLITGRRRR